jgi:hypothetical protein
MGLPLRSGLSLSRTNTRVQSEFHVAVRLMRAVLKSDVVLPGSERRLGGTESQKNEQAESNHRDSPDFNNLFAVRVRFAGLACGFGERRV